MNMTDSVRKIKHRPERSRERFERMVIDIIEEGD